MADPPQVLSIGDDEELYRRIVSFHLNSDGSINSAAFKLRGKPDPHLSVELARLTTPQECALRPGRPGFGVAVLEAQVPRSLGLRVRHDPCPPEDPANYAHALIEGNSSKENCRRLAAASVLIKP
jgi:hypothetical protein